MLDGLLPALSGLTTRGRCFLTAGVACALCALLLGERDLLRVALLLLALPLVSVAVVSRTRYRLSLTRGLEPPRVVAGSAATVVLRLENVSRLPSGVMLMEDTLPWSLGGRPRFVLDRVEPRGVRELGYPVQPEVRGRYPVGPLAVRLTDPFGMCELPRSFASVDTLTATPVVTPLPAVRLGGEWTGGGDASARSVATSGEDDAATREYRVGDDLRKVHWRSTARAGELMVRREEQPWQSRAALVLDTRAAAHAGVGPESSFEYAVSAAASIGVHLLSAGFSLRLLGDRPGSAGTAAAGTAGVAGAGTAGVARAGPGVGFGAGGGSTETALLDRLTLVEADRDDPLTPALTGLRRAGEGLLVAVLGALDPELTAALARLRSGTTTCVAVLLDVEEWLRGAPAGPTGGSVRVGSLEATARVLEAAGWRVVRVPPGVPLADVWSQAGIRTGGRSGAGAGGPLRAPSAASTAAEAAFVGAAGSAGVRS